MNDQITIEETNQKLKFPVGAIFLIASPALWLVLNLSHLSYIPVFDWLYFAGILATGILALCKKNGLTLVIPLAIAEVFGNLIPFFNTFNNPNPLYKPDFLSCLTNFSELFFVAAIILLALCNIKIKVLNNNKKFILYGLYVTFGLALIAYFINFFRSCDLYFQDIYYYINFGDFFFDRLDSILFVILFFIGGLLLGMYLADPYQKPKTPQTPSTNSTSEAVANEYYISLGKHVCLLIFTFGIWNFIWIHKTTRYTNLAKGEEERNPTNKLLLCMFVPFYSIYWTYKTALRVDSIAKERGVASDLGTICLILAIFVGFVPPILLQDKINGILTAAPVAETKNDSFDNIEALEKYKELLDKGIITQEEFDAKKKEILGL